MVTTVYEVTQDGSTVLETDSLREAVEHARTLRAGNGPILVADHGLGELILGWWLPVFPWDVR